MWYKARLPWWANIHETESYDHKEMTPKGQVIQEYLMPTELCDCGNAQLKERASEIVMGVDTPREASQRIFRYVRDAIPFNATLDIYQKASQTLQKRVVDYCNKVNVHVALLRAAGLPARCHLVRVEKEVLKAFVPSFLYGRLPSPVGHFWCECYLAGRWVACEALFDRPLYQGMLEAGLIAREQIPALDWDGEGDLILLRSWIVEDLGSYPSYDELVKLAQEEGMPPKVLCKLFDWLPAFFSHRRTEQLRRR
jgi:transglutaminase-like putative cysteine protease